jgi:hypothetical protein
MKKDHNGWLGTKSVLPEKRDALSDCVTDALQHCSKAQQMQRICVVSFSNSINGCHLQAISDP